jgi:hypothetical protein
MGEWGVGKWWRMGEWGVGKWWRMGERESGGVVENGEVMGVTWESESGRELWDGMRSQ